LPMERMSISQHGFPFRFVSLGVIFHHPIRFFGVISIV
jgi:hypothetical protein